MDDKNEEGSLLESFQEAPAATEPPIPETGVSVPELSFTMPAPTPEVPADFAMPPPDAAPPTDALTVSELNVGGTIIPENIAGVPTPDAFIGDLPTPEAPETAIVGENLTDPVESVNQMLGEAAVAAEQSLEAPIAAASEGPAEGFSLVIYGPISADLWKKAVENPAFKDLSLATEPPKERMLVSRLSEYQVIHAAYALQELGIPAQPKPPGAIIEALPSTESEGAPKVNLPRDAKDVFLYSGDQPAGYKVQNLEGLVSTHRSIARRFFRDLEAKELLEQELQKLQKPSKIRKLFPASAMERLFGGIFLDLQKAALSRGANGVIALRVEAFPESTSLDPDLEQIRLVALGTAAVVEKADI
jgi:hypothetical protein